MKAFPDRLKALRGNMKQAEFARKLGVAQNSYHRYEAGERVPDINVLSQMASVLGVSADWLLGRGEEKDGVSAGYRAPGRVAEPQAEDGAYCPNPDQKDKTIANQAESIVNLTRSLAKLVGSGLSAKK